MQPLISIVALNIFHCKKKKIKNLCDSCKLKMPKKWFSFTFAPAPDIQMFLRLYFVEPWELWTSAKLITNANISVG